MRLSIGRWAPPIVEDLKLQLVISPQEFNRNYSRFGMLYHVLQCFLGDPE